MRGCEHPEGSYTMIMMLMMMTTITQQASTIVNTGEHPGATCENDVMTKKKKNKNKNFHFAEAQQVASRVLPKQDYDV